MARIVLESRGSFRKTDNFLQTMKRKDIYKSLEHYGRMGTNGLQAATPVETGITANAWYHKVSRSGKYYSITWYNYHVDSGIPIVILLQYGHATKNGGFVQGRDFINPVIVPLFNQISNEVWKAVQKA